MVDSSFSDGSTLISGPSFHVDLSALDALHPIHYSRRLLIFRCASSSQRDAQLASLKAGLQVLVSRCPILGGVVIPFPSDISSDRQQNWRTIVPDKGIELVVKDLRTAIPSFKELEAAHFPVESLSYDLLVPVPRDVDSGKAFAACKMQFSSIDGGTILTFAMSHSVADGSATNELLRILSEGTRLAQESSTHDLASEFCSTAVTMRMGEDRSVLRSMTSDLDFDIENHPAYMLSTNLSVDKKTPENAPTHPFEAVSPEIPVLLYITSGRNNSWAPGF